VKNWKNRFVETMIVSAFPGCGKSYCVTHNTTGLSMHDSDSSKYHKKIDTGSWPKDYLDHIIDLKDSQRYEIIFVSCHKEVREALYEENIPYVLVYPSLKSLEAYSSRYLERGNSNEFIELLKKNWADWVNGCREEENVLFKKELWSDEFLGNKVEEIYYKWLRLNNEI
jgi:hypothetical protein